MSALVSYTLDDDDVIVEVEGDWSMVEGDVIGSSIWTHVRSEGLRDLYRRLFERTRGGESIVFDYRCDSPTHRRYMRMTVERADELLRLKSTLLREVERDAPLAVVAASRGQTLISRCSVCNAYGVGARWTDITDAVTAHRLLSDDRPVRVVHSVCPTCHGSLSAIVQKS